MSVRLEYVGVRVDVLAIEMLPMEIERLNKFCKETSILNVFSIMLYICQAGNAEWNKHSK